ncbi:ABC transporter ATP-binding protein [bacterium]|nr:ABC transporter ATP-binding protein [bacterium]MCI0603660.1 ABC transporter ATP-binding protein [bacterium]
MNVSLKIRDVHKHYGNQNRIEVLSGISLDMDAGESLAIMGPSGSGKSTLLHIIGTLDFPTSGEIAINNANPARMKEPDLAKFRNQVIGFVFQDHHLLPQYSVFENILIPALANSKNSASVEKRAKDLIERVGLGHRIDHPPSQLSGGERQRAAIARALINKPSLLLCDEPTGNLDAATAGNVASLLFDMHELEQNILIVVTHNAELAKPFDRCLRLREGRLLPSR